MQGLVFLIHEIERIGRMGAVAKRIVSQKGGHLCRSSAIDSAVANAIHPIDGNFSGIQTKIDKSVQVALQGLEAAIDSRLIDIAADRQHVAKISRPPA